MSAQENNDAAVGAILVGGKSERMGSLKQALALPDGRSFVRATYDTLATMCAEVVLLGAPRTDEERALGITFIDDAISDGGPLAGLVALLESGRAERYLVTSCDAPLVERADLEPLLASSAEAAHYGAPDGGSPLFLPALLCASVASRARKLLDENRRALRHLYEAADVDVLPVEATRAPRLVGVNTPEELEELLALVRAG